MTSPALLAVQVSCDPLGPARVISGTLTEGISSPTSASLIVQLEHFVDIAPVVGADATVEMSISGTVVRAFKLEVAAIQFQGTAMGGATFALELRHSLAKLAHRRDVRMFQESSTQEIVSDVLSRAGIGPVQWKVNRDLPKRTFCLQYRETDQDFMHRLLEHEGVFYVTKGADGSLTMGDAPEAFAPIEGTAEIPFVGDGNESGIIDFEIAYRSVTDKLCLRDFNYENPNLDMTPTSTVFSPPRTLRYEYPGGYTDQAQARAIADIRKQEMAAKLEVGRGASDRVELAAGCHFVLEGTLRSSIAQKYLLRTVVHRFSNAKAKTRYRNFFVCSPFAQPYRPARVTSPPRLPGSESVVVKGPPGAEIHTDELGRMKGRFFWDRSSSDDATASCWMRVIQLPIGASLALARTGWEMTVRYVNGDPDRPLGTFRVDNGGHAAPYKYPAAASAMSFKTLSSPSSGKFNEFTMEDGAGGMKFGVNASKDWSEQTNNNKSETIAVDEKLDVGVDSLTTIGAKQQIDVSASHTKLVSGSHNTAVNGDRTKTVGASETLTIMGSLGCKIAGTDSETVGAGHTTIAAMGVSRTSKGSATLTVGASMVSVGGTGCAVSVAGSRSESVGAAKLVASGASIAESVKGSAAVTVGGAIVHAAGGERASTATGASVITVGAVALATAGGKVQIKAKTIKITVMGVVGMVGGGASFLMTPGSASFVGLVTLKGSGGVKLTGAPNLVG